MKYPYKHFKSHPWLVIKVLFDYLLRDLRIKGGGLCKADRELIWQTTLADCNGVRWRKAFKSRQ